MFVDLLMKRMILIIVMQQQLNSIITEMQIIQTTGFSCAANVFDDDVPDEAPAEDAEAFPIDEVID